MSDIRNEGKAERDYVWRIIQETNRWSFWHTYAPFVMYLWMRDACLALLISYLSCSLHVTLFLFFQRYPLYQYGKLGEDGPLERDRMLGAMLVDVVCAVVCIAGAKLVCFLLNVPHVVLAPVEMTICILLALIGVIFTEYSSSKRVHVGFVIVMSTQALSTMVVSIMGGFENDLMHVMSIWWGACLAWFLSYIWRWLSSPCMGGLAMSVMMLGTGFVAACADAEVDKQCSVVGTLFIYLTCALSLPVMGAFQNCLAKRCGTGI